MIRVLPRLFRLRLAVLNGVSAMAGYLLYPAETEKAAIGAVFTGVTFLAAGASAFNQVQERELDSLMARTRLRPVPSGDLQPGVAALLGGLSTVAGLLILAIAGGVLPVLLGAGSLAWYLGLYTPLKRRTTLALAVGAVCGAVPPVIGWCIAGGNAADYRVVLLAGLLYLWQIPHFWLFQHRHAEDYRRAGVPLLCDGSRGTGATACCRLWICALLAAALLLPVVGIADPHLTVWYPVFLLPLVIMSGFRTGSALFSYLNLFPLFLTLLLFAGK